MIASETYQSIPADSASEEEFLLASPRLENTIIITASYTFMLTLIFASYKQSFNVNITNQS